MEVTVSRIISAPGFVGQVAKRSVLFCFQNKVSGKERILKIVVGISGASGSIYGLRLLQKLRSNPEAETHLIVTRSAEKTLFLETGKKPLELRELAHYCYAFEDIGASLASGSFISRAPWASATKAAAMMTKTIMSKRLGSRPR